MCINTDSPTNDKEFTLRHLRQIAEALFALFGKHCEVCIHDLENLEQSLLHIVGSVTGRTVGAPATDLLTKALQQPVSELSDYQRYRTTTTDGRVLNSSTIFIRDRTGKPCFAVCINLDTTDYFNACRALESLLAPAPDDNHTASDRAETFCCTPAETVTALFDQAVIHIGRQPATMSTSERIELVRLLAQSGALQFKNAVEQIATLAGVSKYTIYNHLREIRAMNPGTTKPQ